MIIKRLFLLAALAASCALSACAGASLNDEALKASAIGINLNTKTGISGGSVSLTGISAPKATKDGKTVFAAMGPCGQTDTPDVASNLNSNATASASGTNQGAAWASGDQFYTGLAARYVGLGGGQAPSPDAIAAAQTCSGSPPAAPVKAGGQAFGIPADLKGLVSNDRAPLQAVPGG
jgi:hypothetical protein